MAKRGWKATHRVRYAWENGIKGTIACYSLSEAQAKETEIRRTAENREMTVQVEVQEITR